MLQDSDAIEKDWAAGDRQLRNDATELLSLGANALGQAGLELMLNSNAARRLVFRGVGPRLGASSLGASSMEGPNVHIDCFQDCVQAHDAYAIYPGLFKFADSYYYWSRG